jgi:hypothetical protein
MRELYTRFFAGHRIDWRIFPSFPLFASPFSLTFLKFPNRNFLDGLSQTESMHRSLTHVAASHGWREVPSKEMKMIMKKFLVLGAAIGLLAGCASDNDYDYQGGTSSEVDSRVGASAPGSSSGSIGGTAETSGSLETTNRSSAPSLPGSTRDSGTGSGAGTGSGTGTGTGTGDGTP